MMLPFGDLHHHNLEPLRCHLIISCVRFGLSLAIATLVLSTLLQDLRVSTTLLLSAPEVYLRLLEGTCLCNNNMANLIDRPAIDTRIEATIVQQA